MRLNKVLISLSLAMQKIGQPQNLNKTGKSDAESNAVCRRQTKRHKDENGARHHQV